MASVSSLDKDLKAMRLDKYTPARANEVRNWIESVLGDKIDGDLLEALKDGTILCRLANTALGPNSVRFKQSAMPFVQMENISHFLRVCQSPPLSMPAHDVFLTVDLYETKDPAQVLQCIEAFSRKAAARQPGRISTAIGGKKATNMSPTSTGTRSATSFSPPQAHNGTGSGRTSPTKGAISGAPAWNYAQYGWMGGASQGNQGVAFGSRRQITTPGPDVPSLADKERRRKEAESEAEKRKQEEESAERKRRASKSAQEAERTAREERQRADDEARRREEERLAVEAEKRRWEEEERKWRQEEDERKREESDAESRLEKERQRRRANSDARLKGQLLSQYQAEQEQISSEKTRIAELERQLAEAKTREQQYEDERNRLFQHKEPPVSPPRNTQPAASKTINTDQQAWDDAERDHLREQWKANQTPTSPRPLPTPQSTISPSARPLPVPAAKQVETPTRALPDPTAYKPSPQPPNRTDRFLADNPAPAAASPVSHVPQDAIFNSTAESDAEAQRRLASQKATKAGGWAGKSLLEREMERERQRQQEWEEAQKQTQDAAAKGARDPNAGSGPGQSWDVHTYGYTGGDNMNRGSSGIYAGRRQILGPRPLEKK